MPAGGLLPYGNEDLVGLEEELALARILKERAAADRASALQAATKTPSIDPTQAFLQGILNITPGLIGLAVSGKEGAAAGLEAGIQGGSQFGETIKTRQKNDQARAAAEYKIADEEFRDARDYSRDVGKERRALKTDAEKFAASERGKNYRSSKNATQQSNFVLGILNAARQADGKQPLLGFSGAGGGLTPSTAQSITGGTTEAAESDTTLGRPATTTLPTPEASPSPTPEADTDDPRPAPSGQSRSLTDVVEGALANRLGTSTDTVKPATYSSEGLQGLDAVGDIVKQGDEAVKTRATIDRTQQQTKEDKTKMKALESSFDTPYARFRVGEGTVRTAGEIQSMKERLSARGSIINAFEKMLNGTTDSLGLGRMIDTTKESEMKALRETIANLLVRVESIGVPNAGGTGGASAQRIEEELKKLPNPTKWIPEILSGLNPLAPNMEQQVRAAVNEQKQRLLAEAALNDLGMEIKTAEGNTAILKLINGVPTLLDENGNEIPRDKIKVQR